MKYEDLTDTLLFSLQLVKVKGWSKHTFILMLCYDFCFDLNRLDRLVVQTQKLKLEMAVHIFQYINFSKYATVAPPQRPTAAILYSNPHGCPCTLSGDLHGGVFGSTDT